MASDLSQVFVIDVESTCWATPEEQGTQPNELIEIGICSIHRKDGIQNKTSYLIKPRFTKVSPFCTELTGWTQADVDEGRDIADTLRKIGEDFKMTPNSIWFSYGEYDRLKLSSSPDDLGGVGHLYGIKRKDNPIARMRTHINIKTLMALREGLAREMGMERALKYYGMSLDGRHHNGADDAANIAKIVVRNLS